jgi:hypothetical protein
MFSQAHPAAPGELMEIDSTPLDIMVLLDDGVPAPCPPPPPGTPRKHRSKTAAG